jgi:cobalt-zinc-cadmium efflux system protein
MHQHKGQSCEHNHSYAIEHQKKGLKISLLIAGIFTVVEIIGGIIANSLALISDALHLFTDVGALLLSLAVVYISKKPKTQKRSFGYYRAEILGALASSISLWVLCFVIIYEGIRRLFAPPEVHGALVLIIASVGLIANIMMMRILHPIQQHGLHMRSVYLHVLGDLLGSVAVIIGGAIIWFANWNAIDPILSIVFALGILFSSGKVIKQCVSILMESSPEELDPDAIQKDLETLPGVKEVHNLHIWSISSKRKALSVHIVASSPQETLKEAHRLLEKKYDIHHMTIQVEDPQHFEPKYCYDREKKYK